MTTIEKIRQLVEAVGRPDLPAGFALTIGDCAELIHEIDRLHERAERAEKLLGRFGEELVSAGCAPGDSDQQLSQFRRLLADAQSTREACARICDERAKSAAKDLDAFDDAAPGDYDRIADRGAEAADCAAAIRAGGKP